MDELKELIESGGSDREIMDKCNEILNSGDLTKDTKDEESYVNGVWEFFEDIPF